MKEHQDYGEVFGEWRLYESARACHNFLSKRKLLDRFVEVMGEHCDFLHPRINNSTVLQSIQYVTSVVLTTLYDGVAAEDMNLLILELARLCVSWIAGG